MFVEPHDFPKVLKRAFPSYQGRKFQIKACEQVTLTGDSWSEGSRSTYVLVELATGVAAGSAAEFTNPFTSPTQGRTPTLDMRPGYAVVEHCTFRGKDMGLRAYVHPDNIAPMLPAPAPDISDCERKALEIVCSMSGKSYRIREWQRLGLPSRYDASSPLIQSLYRQGLVTINKAGSIAATIVGRNLYRQQRGL